MLHLLVKRRREARAVYLTSVQLGHHLELIYPVKGCHSDNACDPDARQLNQSDYLDCYDFTNTNTNTHKKMCSTCNVAVTTRMCTLWQCKSMPTLTMFSCKESFINIKMWTLYRCTINATATALANTILSSRHQSKDVQLWHHTMQLATH